MSDFGSAVTLALGLIIGGNAELYGIIGLSLGVSIGAAVIAALVGTPAGAALAVYRFRGRRAVVVLVNAMLGLPPVVVGLAGYLLLSRSGPLGGLGLLYTPAAMVAVQSVLALPIVAAIVHRTVEDLWARFGEGFQVAGATRLEIIPQLLRIGRAQILTAALAGFGRTISEVGAIIIVGGNIAGATRTMTTAIALQTSMGNLPLALALGLVLISLSLLFNGLAFTVAGQRKYP
ncbi:MAG TPA: ABC transporter permease [Stellaceae bacterium]|nr:ABC transporter permease [Stellaceae bacterium]